MGPADSGHFCLQCGFKGPWFLVRVVGCSLSGCLCFISLRNDIKHGFSRKPDLKTHQIAICAPILWVLGPFTRPHHDTHIPMACAQKVPENLATKYLEPGVQLSKMSWIKNIPLLIGQLLNEQPTTRTRNQDPLKPYCKQKWPESAGAHLGPHISTEAVSSGKCPGICVLGIMVDVYNKIVSKSKHHRQKKI